MNFEKLLMENKRIVERYVFFRISNKQDAEDILQETYLSAFQNFESLNDKNLFKAWIIRIAKNKCNNYYRANRIETIDESNIDLCFVKSSIGERFEIFEIINQLSDNEKEILTMYYFNGYSQEEISKKLNIPIGTVKSRLFSARNNFKSKYTDTPPVRLKGDNIMLLPKVMPNYRIIKSNDEAFSVVCEELMGWMIIPKLNEKIQWALYDDPSRKQTERVGIEVVGKAIVHDVEGVEIIAKEYNPVEANLLDSVSLSERKFIAQLTDTHCRFLAESHKQNGVTRYYTFLDDNEFTKNWGYGENNCGKEINLSSKGIVIRTDNKIVCDINVMDIVGRYTVEINGKTFDTVCLMDIETYDEGVVTEQYIDKNGKTVLWRRFNADDWKYDVYQQLWSEKLPKNETLFINDKKYIHWYDCISDYIM